LSIFIPFSKIFIDENYLPKKLRFSKKSFSFSPFLP